MSRDKVTFETNQPTLVVLDSTGTEQAGNNGEEYRYFLQGNQIMWVTPEVHNRIQATGAKKGDAITITMAKHNGSPATWVVEGPPPEQRATKDLRRAITAPASRAPEPLSELERRANRQPQPAASMAQQLPDAEGEIPLDGHEGALYTALTAAISATMAAQTYAHRCGIQGLQFDRCDIVKFATTIYISMSEGGPR